MTARFAGMEAHDGQERTVFTDGSSILIRTEYSPEQWAEAITDFATPPALPTGHPALDAAKRSRTILDASGAPVGHLVSHEEYKEMRDAEHALADLAERARGDGQPYTRYQPFVHAPDNTPDRLLPTDHLESLFAAAIALSPVDDEARAQALATMYAIDACLRTALDADDRGIVPIRVANGPMDAEITEYFWAFAFVTPVAGLYVRASEAIFGPQYSVVCAAGYFLRNGFATRELADAFAVDIATSLPGVDWFLARPDQFTAESKSIVRDVIQRHPLWGESAAKAGE